MEKDTFRTRAPALSMPAARAAAALSTATLALLALLHLLSPEFDPARRMVSEYALGRYGWVLALMFLAWGSSTAALFAALRPHARTWGGRIGLALLLVAALGMAMAAFFDIRTPLHGLAALLGNLPFVIAAVLVSVSLVRTEPRHAARRPLLWTAHLPWASLVLMAAVVLAGMTAIGWPNRALVAAYCVWILAAAGWVWEAER